MWSGMDNGIWSLIWGMGRLQGLGWGMGYGVWDGEKDLECGRTSESGVGSRIWGLGLGAGEPWGPEWEQGEGPGMQSGRAVRSRVRRGIWGLGWGEGSGKKEGCRVWDGEQDLESGMRSRIWDGYGEHTQVWPESSQPLIPSVLQTYIGNVVISVNPYQSLPIYTPEKVEEYHNCSFFAVKPHM